MKLGRNEPCHCGSGKKYKQCCLPKDEAEELASVALVNQQRAEQEAAKKEVVRLQRESHKRELRNAMDEFLTSDSQAEEDWEEEEGNKKTVTAKKATPNWESAEDDSEEAFEEEEQVPLGQLSPEEKAKYEAEREQAQIFWDDFNTHDAAGMAAIFESKLMEEQPLHSAFALEMLSAVYAQTLHENVRALYPPLVAKLRQAAPRAYRVKAHYYLEHLINNAFAEKQTEALPAFVRELALLAGRHPDIFNKVLAQLFYHDQVELVNEALRSAWPRITNPSANIFSWAIDECAAEGMRGLVCKYLAEHASPAAGDAALFEAIQFFTLIEPDRINGYIALISGHDQRQWRAEEFDFTKKSAKQRKREAKTRPDAEPISPRENLIALSMAFQGYAHRKHGIPLLKAELAREGIVKYIFMRLNGELQPRQSMLDSVLRPKSERELRDPPYHPEWPSHARALCPHPQMFDRFMGELLHMFNPQYHRLAALFELMPVWLEFLVEQKLIAASQQAASMQELECLHEDVLVIFKKSQEDPALYQALLRWPEQAA